MTTIDLANATPLDIAAWLAETPIAAVLERVGDDAELADRVRSAESARGDESRKGLLDKLQARQPDGPDDDLLEQAAAAGIDPGGLSADELAEHVSNAQLTGRPPLAQVGVAAQAAQDAVTTVIETDHDQVIAESPLVDPATTTQED